MKNMTLEEAKKEIARLKEIIANQEAELEDLRKRKNAGRKPKNEKWQRSYQEFVDLYEQGLTMVEIAGKVSSSSRTCYRYKAYYDALQAKKEAETK